MIHQNPGVIVTPHNFSIHLYDKNPKLSRSSEKIGRKIKMQSHHLSKREKISHQIRKSSLPCIDLPCITGGRYHMQNDSGSIGS